MYWGLVQGRGGEFLHGILKKYIFGAVREKLCGGAAALSLNQTKINIASENTVAIISL